MNFPLQKFNEIFEPSTSLKGIFSVWGEFGVGKSTFALQTAINEAESGKVIYIYSKPNFPFGKIKNLGQKISFDYLNNINLIILSSFAELNSIIFNLETLILNYLNFEKIPLKLIIIDSITDLYRLELNKDKKRKNVTLSYQLNQILATLAHINRNYEAEILIVNELSRKSHNDNVMEVQSGGKVMDYWITYSMKLVRTEKINIRKFILTKHPQHKKFEISTLLTLHGFE
jgi:RecA/RadA recombinase